MARPRTGGKFPVPMSTRFTAEEAAAIDALLKPGVSRSEWLHAAALSVLAAADPEPASRRRGASCANRLPAGAFCKVCGQVHK